MNCCRFFSPRIQRFAIQAFLPMTHCNICTL